MSGKRKQPPVPLFDSVVFAPDRDSIPGARPVISWDEEDEAPYLKAIEEVATRRAKLSRRGHDHGAWAELDLSASGVDPLRRATPLELARERWQAARPQVLPNWLGAYGIEVNSEDATQPNPAQAEASAGLQLGYALQTPGALADYVKQKAAALPKSLNPKAPGTASNQPEDPRDVERVLFSQAHSTLAQAPNLWLKTGRLSDHPQDSSLRLRVSFGSEVEDDASRDEASHRAVTGLAEALLPGAPRIDLNPKVNALLAELAQEELTLTQHIAYWNAPEGGALLHHDAFGEADCGGQRGVLYTQLAGCTAWIALSANDLADRVEDYCEFLEAGGADWVRKALWPDRRDFDRVQARIRNREACLAELLKPGCGSFGPLVNLGPEFTSFLADAGHAFFLGPGDAVLMPSHSLSECTLHSVFCASDEMTYGISAALRGTDPA